METLGKITKPEASSYKAKRKIFLVPLLFSGSDAPLEYIEKLNRYWDEVENHIASLESHLGTVSHIYHELVFSSGPEALTVAEKLSRGSYHIAKSRYDIGATFEALEDRDLLDEVMDWERIIFMGLLSPRVAQIAADNYTDASRRRYEYIGKQIDSTLGEGESGILFIREGHGVQLPSDIEIFSVAPPTLDEIHRWQRDRAAEMQDKEGTSVEETGSPEANGN